MNSRKTFVSKFAGVMSAVALAVVLSGGFAHAQQPAAPADPAAAPAMTDPAAAPVDPAAAPADPAADPAAAPAEGATTTSDQVEVENPYGFEAMWEHGDW